MAKLKQVMREYKTKIRQCPKCKSKKGFELSYSVHGSGFVHMDFKGNTTNAERNIFDRNDNFANCLNCGFSIDAERLKTD